VPTDVGHVKWDFPVRFPLGLSDSRTKEAALEFSTERLIALALANEVD
jgi:hypothetical protein